MKTQTVRDWKVIRKGKIYCAPACGGDCSFVQYAAMKKQAEKMCKELGEGWEPKLTHNSYMEVNRLALNMDQVEQYQPPHNPAKQTDARFQGYVTEYGESSWELDALEPAVISELIETAIMDIMDQDIWEESTQRQDDARAKISKIANETKW